MSGQKRLNGFSRTQMSYRARDYESDYGNEDKISKVEGISRAFAKMTCINSNFQLKMIESSAFREFFGHLTPRFQLGTLESLKADCLKIYREEGRKIKEILRNRDGQVSLSVEKLKSRDRNCYMCLAAHFLDDTWKMNRWVLLVWIANSYNLLVPVLKSLNYWEIEEKISSFTFKTDTDIDETVNKVKDHIQKKKALWLNGRLFHVRCWTNLIDSMVWDAFDQISDTIDKIDEFVNSAVLDSYYQHNATNRTQLRSDNGHDCINWRGTLPHWHLNCSMLKEALELHSREDYSSLHVPHNYLLSADEWKKVEVICKLVDKLKNIRRILFETKYINASILLSNLLELHVSLSYEASIADSYSSVIFTKMLLKLDNYGKDSFLVLAVATVMDPRCKMMYIEYLSSKFATRDCNLKLSTVSEAVRVLYDNYAASTPQQWADSTSDSDYSYCDTDTSESEKEDYPSKKRKAGISKCEVEGYENLENTEEIPNHDLEEKNNPKKREVISKCEEEGNNNIKSHLHGYQQFVQSTIRPPKSDLELYLGEPVVPWSQELNLLDWWKVASPKYPILCKMARDVLSILLSSSDALFGEERKVDSCITSHGPALVNALMCVRSWLPKN
ncbi:zinc finger BED domain-containing protein RICESLEEPER 1-like [Olea europaea var. sylvestris]|uniref:zinc finger BED domain-containing protein RICESLEEPER 1-like n=1 Tax=Olea europaea var. sylvestris TaxID=158386 RepID=UPI000C1D0007|nr:zinc finger BED domain-containing protein RICESLEEPER 1-like [Olea europaea var. sylvestris]